MFGKNHTIEARNKIREFRLKYKYSEEGKKNMSLTRIGEKNGNSKLKIDEVLKIRQYFTNGEYNQKELAIMFNIKPAAISKIINRTTWKHI